MMNLPLLLWAWRETGDGKYGDAAIIHYHTTMNYLIRGDGSSFHHYQFEPASHMPVRGLTFQGYADDSCWSRGHAWLISGFPIAYSYTKNEELVGLHKKLVYYFLNHLPSDGLPYWDLTFAEGSAEPRDSSAAAIAVCGLLEMCKYLPEDAPQKKIYQNAAACMTRAIIHCGGDHAAGDGLLGRVTHDVPRGNGIEGSAVYGDYFYLEALTRQLMPDWNTFW
jgi:unsaturated chondroitin disaccharide hydrolase